MCQLWAECWDDNAASTASFGTWPCCGFDGLSWIPQVTAALCEGASLQWSPSLMAAAVLIAARRHQVLRLLLVRTLQSSGFGRRCVCFPTTD